MRRHHKRLAWRPLPAPRQRLPARRSFLVALLGLLIGARRKPSQGSSE